jgi:hypothetical protein
MFPRIMFPGRRSGVPWQTLSIESHFSGAPSKSLQVSPQVCLTSLRTLFPRPEDPVPPAESCIHLKAKGPD